MSNGPLYFPRKTIAASFVDSIIQQVETSTKYLGPLVELEVGMSPLTAAILMKAKKLGSLLELRDLIGCKSIITSHLMREGEAVIWRADQPPRWRWVP
jgi:hypothetical protein